MSHTPGPWVIDESRYGKHGPVSMLMVVAEKGGMPGLIVNQGSVEPRDYANARLVAAAPELLEAARKIVGIIDSYGCGFYNQQQFIDGETMLRAAIAKAEGK
jgi:hypothetical protein